MLESLRLELKSAHRVSAEAGSEAGFALARIDELERRTQKQVRRSVKARRRGSVVDAILRADESQRVGHLPYA